MKGTEIYTWKVSGLKLKDDNKHNYWVLFCKSCGNILPARADHIKAGEVIKCACQSTSRNRRGSRRVTNLQRRANGWAFTSNTLGG